MPSAFRLATRNALLGAVLLGLSACVSTLLNNGPPEVRHSLLPVAAPQLALTQAAGRPSIVVRVVRPQVPAAYRGSQLVLLRGANASVYAGQAWEADLQDMLAAALARDLARLLPGYAIVSEDASVEADLEVQSELRSFATVQAAAGQPGAAVLIDIDLRVVDATRRSILQTLPYHYREALPQLTTTATVEAFNRGWQQLVPQVAGQLQNTVPVGKTMLKSHRN